MADGVYQNGFALHDELTGLDVRAVCLNDTNTPVFDARDRHLADVLARSENTEQVETRDANVPNVTFDGTTVDHGDIVVADAGTDTLLAVVYYVLGSSDSDSPVLFFKDINQAVAAEQLTISTHANGLVDISQLFSYVLEGSGGDKNEPYQRIMFADLNQWSETHSDLGTAVA